MNEDDKNLIVQGLRSLVTVYGDDPEALHSKADDLLLKAVDPEVREMYERVRSHADWWAAG